MSLTAEREDQLTPESETGVNCAPSALCCKPNCRRPARGPKQRYCKEHHAAAVASYRQRKGLNVGYVAKLENRVAELEKENEHLRAQIAKVVTSTAADIIRASLV